MAARKGRSVPRKSKQHESKDTKHVQRFKENASRESDLRLRAV